MWRKSQPSGPARAYSGRQARQFPRSSKSWLTRTPASTKVRAADSVLDHGAKAIEIEDIEARVAELERASGSMLPNGRKRAPLR
jgi:hypothetical protein